MSKISPANKPANNNLPPDYFVPPPRPLVQRFGAILWPSFLTAGLGTLVVFGLYDPADLAYLIDPSWDLDRQSGYAFGFFCFWALNLVSSTLTWWLLRPAARFRRPS